MKHIMYRMSEIDDRQINRVTRKTCFVTLPGMERTTNERNYKCFFFFFCCCCCCCCFQVNILYTFQLKRHIFISSYSAYDLIVLALEPETDVPNVIPYQNETNAINSRLASPLTSHSAPSPRSLLFVIEVSSLYRLNKLFRADSLVWAIKNHS